MSAFGGNADIALLSLRSIADTGPVQPNLGQSNQPGLLAQMLATGDTCGIDDSDNRDERELCVLYGGTSS